MICGKYGKGMGYYCHGIKECDISSQSSPGLHTHSDPKLVIRQDHPHPALVTNLKYSAMTIEALSGMTQVRVRNNHPPWSTLLSPRRLRQYNGKMGPQTRLYLTQHGWQKEEKPPTTFHSHSRTLRCAPVKDQQ